MTTKKDRAIVVSALKHAAPYIRLFKGKVFVLKAGGEIFADPVQTSALMEQVGILHQVGIRVVLIHGGGPQSTELATALGLDTTFVDGRRVTDGASLDDRQHHARIAEAFNCRRQTVEKLRQRVVTEGFESALNGKQRQTPPTPPKLDGEGEAKLLAMRLGKPPVGYGHWTLRLLASELVSLEVVDSISPETVRTTLKKMV